MKKETVNGLGNRMDDFEFVVVSKDEAPEVPVRDQIDQDLPPQLRRQGSKAT